MNRLFKLLLVLMALLFWLPGRMDSASIRNLKGDHVYSLDQSGLSIQKRIKQAEERFSREFRGDYFLSGYTFESRGNSRIGGTTIEYQGESVSRITHQGDRLVIRTFGHGLDKDDKVKPEITDRDIVFLHKKKQNGFEIVGLGLLDDGRPYEIKEIPFFWLGRLNGSESLSFLKKMFNRGEGCLRQNILAAIAMHNHDGSANFLYLVAEKTGYPLELRKNAIFWLGTIKSNLSWAYLKKIAARESEYVLRKQLVFAFYLDGSPGAVRELIR
jgi:hypothetical protein